MKILTITMLLAATMNAIAQEWSIPEEIHIKQVRDTFGETDERGQAELYGVFVDTDGQELSFHCQREKSLMIRIPHRGNFYWRSSRVDCKDALSLNYERSYLRVLIETGTEAGGEIYLVTKENLNLRGKTRL